MIRKNVRWGGILDATGSEPAVLGRFRRAAWAALALGLFLAGESRAAAPDLLTYQGRLKESGVPVTGSRTVEIQLCSDSGGVTCFTTGVQTIAVTNGVFRSTFSAPSTVDLTTGQWYVKVLVAGTALSPLEQLSASAYAVYASSAGTLAAAPGSGGVQVSTNLFVVAGSSVGIGTTSPAYPLHVVGGMTARWLPAGGAFYTLSGYQHSFTGNVALGGSSGDQVSMTGVLISNIVPLSDATYDLGSSVSRWRNLYVGGNILGAGSTWNRSAPTVYLANGADAVVAQGTMTVQGNAFSVGGSTFVVFGSSVGIGTTNPLGKLDVIGTSRFIQQLNGQLSAVTSLFPVGQQGAFFQVYGTPDTTLTNFERTSLFHDTMAGAGGIYTDALGTGVARPIVLKPNNVEVMRLTTTGNVGVGTTNPANKLHVSGVARIDGNVSGDDLFIWNGSGGGAGSKVYMAGDTTTSDPTVVVNARIGFLDNTNTGAHILFENRDSGGGTTTTERMRIASNGNVGVGTASPAYQLHSAGTLFVASNTIISSTLTVQGNAFSVGGSTFSVVGGTVNVDNGALTVGSGGNVGVGTTSPTSIFHVLGNMPGAAFQFQGSGANANPALYVKALPGAGHAQIVMDRADTGGVAGINWYNGGTFQWKLSMPDFTSGDATRLDLLNSASIARMTFLQSGNVGVGTASPAYALDVNGGAIVRSSLTVAGLAAAPPAAAAGQGALYFANNGAAGQGFQVSSGTAFWVPLPGRQLFSANGTFIVPAGVATVYVTMCGGGGGGGGSNGASTGGGGGGGAQCVVNFPLTVGAGTAYSITVGGGGAGGANTLSGIGGGSSSFGALANVVGGGPGTAAGVGGSAGAAAATSAGFGGSAGSANAGATGGSGGGSALGGGGAPGLPGGAGAGNGSGGGGGTCCTGAGGNGAGGSVLVQW